MPEPIVERDVDVATHVGDPLAQPSTYPFDPAVPYSVDVASHVIAPFSNEWMYPEVGLPYRVEVA